MPLEKIIKLYLGSLLVKSFPIWQRFGVHITPNHYYQPIPDTRTLQEDLWLKPSELIGIEINEETMISNLAIFKHKFKNEYEKFPRSKTSIPYKYYTNNGAFQSVDGEIYYCMVRYFKPRKIIEVGSGNSTYLAAQAILKNKEDYQLNAELIAIEPYPNDTLRIGFPGLSKLVISDVQDVHLSEFTKLMKNDILFLDSSHVLKVGSDVKYEFTEILPRLNSGVLIHIHDIFLPAEYPREWILKKHLFYNEQYLLQAFLAFNSAFDILWGGSYMHLKHPDKLEDAFGSYRKDSSLPASIWLRKR